MKTKVFQEESGIPPMNKSKVIASLYALYAYDLEKESLYDPKLSRDLKTSATDTHPLLFKGDQGLGPIVDLDTSSPGAYALQKLFNAESRSNPYTKAETSLLLEIALNRELSIEEELLSDELSEICNFADDYDDVGDMNRLIYQICNPNIWNFEFEHFLPVQLVLFLIHATASEISDFWTEVASIIEPYEKIVRIAKNHVCDL